MIPKCKINQQMPNLLIQLGWFSNEAFPIDENVYPTCKICIHLFNLRSNTRLISQYDNRSLVADLLHGEALGAFSRVLLRVVHCAGVTKDSVTKMFFIDFPNIFDVCTLLWSYALKRRAGLGTQTLISGTLFTVHSEIYHWVTLK